MAIDTIIEWASKQPDWQRDALRRVALSSEFADADTSAILANLKRAKGLPPEGALLSESLKKEHLQWLCCKPDVGVSQIRTTTVLSSCLCVGQTVL